MATVLSLVYSRVTKDRMFFVFSHTHLVRSGFSDFQFDLNQNYKPENSPQTNQRGVLQIKLNPGLVRVKTLFWTITVSYYD